MELLCTPLVLIVVAVLGIGLLAAVGVVLVKLGVIARYAVKQEPPDEGEYRLDQSQEPGEQ